MEGALGAALLPFQREGVRRGVEWGGRLLLCDEMGLGKSLQAIAIALHFRQEWPLLLLCPTSMALPWCEELERWVPSLRPGDINLVKSHANSAMSTAPVTILTYGLITNGLEKESLMRNVSAARFGVVIADEAHYLKSRDAKRTQLCLPILAAAKRRILITGTPALSRPVELFTLLSTVEPTAPEWATYSKFVTRFCDARYIWFGRTKRFDVSGSSNREELHTALSRLMVRRLKADVLDELPEKRRQRVGLLLDSSAAAELHAIEREMAALPEDAHFERRSHLSSMCVALGNAKSKAASEYALELLGSTGRILFFGHHKTMLDAMETAATARKVRVFRIDGSVPVTERQSLVQAFQSLPEDVPAIFVLSIQAAGQGLTLTAASTVVFGELRWVPGELLQAEDRAHRIGQQHAVNIHYLVAQDTIDESMWRVLQKKVRNLAQTLDGATARLEAKRQQWASRQNGDSEETDMTDGGSTDSADAITVLNDTLDLRSLRVQRAKEAKREATRAAFDGLFNPKRFAASAHDRTRAVTTCMDGEPSPLGECENGNFDDTLRNARNGISSDPTPESKKAWFAVSSLTGRLHAFGDGDEPVPEGLHANTPLLAVLEDEADHLPSVMAAPAMLAAAKQWATEWLALTPAQRAILHNVPLRVPLLKSAISSRVRPSSSAPVSDAMQKCITSCSASSASVPNAADVTVSTSKQGRFTESGSRIEVLPVPLGSTSGSAIGSLTSCSSTQRETTANRYAEQRVPSLPHVTRTWVTLNTRVQQSWTQHFCIESGLPFCITCLALHEPQPDSPFCSEGCALAYSTARSQENARRGVFGRDLGICQKCGFDAHSFFKKVAAVETSQERLQMLMSSHYSTTGGRIKRMLAHPVEGDFWQADHVLAVHVGGGECDLSNFQTLCTPCHVKKTAREGAVHKRKQAATGMTDLRVMFAPKVIQIE